MSRIHLSVVLVTVLVDLTEYQTKNIKERRLYFGSQFGGIVLDDTEVRVATV